jgi:hypothetical protein
MVVLRVGLVCLCWHRDVHATPADIRHCSFVFPFVVFGVGGECGACTDDENPTPERTECGADVIEQ